MAEMLSKKNIKFILWAISAGTIVAFFFASNRLNFAINFSPGGEVLFISPIFAGFLLGVLTTRDEVYHAVILSIVMTITAVLLISLVLFMPVLQGFWQGWKELYYMNVIKDIMLAVVLIFPVGLTAAIVGKVFGEATLMGSIYKKERAILRDETLEWYEMLEAAVDKEKKKLKAERDKEEAQAMLLHQTGQQDEEAAAEEATVEEMPEDL